MSAPQNPRYPSRCLPATPPAGTAPESGEIFRIHGRLIRGEAAGGLLVDACGNQVRCQWPPGGQLPAIGDILELEGRTEGGELHVERVAVLAPAGGEPTGGWSVWQRQQAGLRRALALRSEVSGAVRAYFAAAGFLEVETPALVSAPGQEAHLLLFETTFRGQPPLECFLVSSPEHHMKRLLGAGCPRIFQLGRAYRNGERSATHNPEFTMLEWYRAYASYEEVMVDVEEVVAAASRAVRGTALLEYQGRQVDLTPPWPRLSVRDAFGEFAGIDLEMSGDLAAWRTVARRSCASVDTNDTWEEIFFKVLLERVEPGMAALGRPVLLVDYPASMAALAKVRGGEGVAERVEAYAGGLELANGFTELNDPDEQRRRFAAERAKRAALGYPVHPLDEDFLQMLRLGMPPAGGMALGMDRLLMLLADAPNIDDVVAFPFAQATGFV